MGILQIIKNLLARSPTAAAAEKTQMQFVQQYANNLYVYDGKIYRSDIVRSCIRPKIKAVGKTVPQHIREDADGEKQIFPDVYMRFLLREPNQLMSWQQYAEKMEAQLILNKNAFALIQRDENGLPAALFPLAPLTVRAEYDNDGTLIIHFWMANGKDWRFYYSDLIHLRDDYNDNDVFGTPSWDALSEVMEVVGQADHGLINAVKNSGVIKWLLVFKSSIREEDLREKAKNFADAFLATEGSGVAATDAKADAKQIDQKDFVPAAEVTAAAVARIYKFFNVNDKIVDSSYSENEWISYYEAQVEPDIIQFAEQHTRKIFTRRQRAFGNRIEIQTASLQYAALSTKLAFKDMVDRGAMTPNEWRGTMGLGPIPGGDKPIRRLDTAPVEEQTEQVEE